MRVIKLPGGVIVWTVSALMLMPVGGPCIVSSMPIIPRMGPEEDSCTPARGACCGLALVAEGGGCPSCSCAAI